MSDKSAEDIALAFSEYNDGKGWRGQSDWHVERTCDNEGNEREWICFATDDDCGDVLFEDAEAIVEGWEAKKEVAFLNAEREAIVQRESPISAFQGWLGQYVRLHRKLTQDEYLMAQAAFFAAHPGQGPQSVMFGQASTVGSWAWAVEQTREGKWVKRPCHRSGDALSIDVAGRIVCRSDPDSGVFLWLDELAASDWQIVEDDKK